MSKYKDKENELNCKKHGAETKLKNANKKIQRLKSQLEVVKGMAIKIKQKARDYEVLEFWEVSEIVDDALKKIEELEGEK